MGSRFFCWHLWRRAQVAAVNRDPALKGAIYASVSHDYRTGLKRADCIA
jgi:hypothetical protein